MSCTRCSELEAEALALRTQLTKVLADMTETEARLLETEVEFDEGVDAKQHVVALNAALRSSKELFQGQSTALLAETEKNNSLNKSLAELREENASLQAGALSSMKDQATVRQSHEAEILQLKEALAQAAKENQDLNLHAAKLKEMLRGANEELSNSQIELLEKETELREILSRTARPKPRKLSEEEISEILQEHFERYSTNLERSGLINSGQQLHRLTVSACFALNLPVPGQEIETRVTQSRMYQVSEDGITLSNFRDWFCKHFPELIR